MNRLLFGLIALSLLSSPALAKGRRNQSAPQKSVSEVEKEWRNFKYYRARYDTDKAAHEEEKEKEAQIRLAQGLPVAKDGLPVVASGGNTNAAATPSENPTPTENNGSVAAIEAPAVDPNDPAAIIAAEKKKQEDERKKQELEAAKVKLLGDQRDESGQVIDDSEDPTTAQEEEKKGFFKRIFGKKKNKDDESNSLDEDE